MFLVETEEGALDAIEPKQAMNSFASDWVDGRGSWFDMLSMSGGWSPLGSKPSVFREQRTFVLSLLKDPSGCCAEDRDDY